MSPRRRLSALLTLLVTLAVITLPWAMLSSKADLSLGPHEATYQLTTDSRVALDFGPLGKLLLPANDYLPLGLGLHVDVGEIPVSAEGDDDAKTDASRRRAESTPESGSASSTEKGKSAEVRDGEAVIDGLGGDIASYSALFSAPQAQIDLIVEGLGRAILIRWALAVAILSGVLVASAFVLGPTRLSGIGRAFVGKELIGVGLVAVLVLSSVGTLVLTRPQPLVADPAFAGTPLAGAQVTGRLGGVIDTAFAAVKEFSDENDEFYTRAVANLGTAWPKRTLTGDWTSAGMVPPAGAGTLDAEGGTGVSTFVLGSDLHCNIGMARIVGEVVRLTRADGYLDAGDITMTGTSAENYCLDVLDEQLPTKLPKVIVKGNHDSSETTDHARTRGWNVLDQSVTTVSGIRFFGAPDPRRTVFGSGPQLETTYTADQYAQRLEEKACGTRFDIMLVHDAQVAAPSLRSGCARYDLSGHWHRRVGPETLGSGVRYVNSTTGGALANALTPGPLRMDAELSIIRIDNRTKRPIDLQVVTVRPNETVAISQWIRFPAPLPLVAQPPAPESPAKTPGRAP